VTRTAHPPTVATTGGEMAFTDEGTGRAVVLLHGLPLSSFVWRGTVPALAARMRVIAPDLIGAGDSAKDDAAALDPDAQAGYVHELLSALEIDSVAAVGHGSGGAVAQALALRDVRVEALVLIDAPAVDGGATAEMRELLWSGEEVSTADDLRRRMKVILASAMHHGERLSDAITDEYARPYIDAGGRRAFARAIAAAADGAAAGGPGAIERLAGLEIPVLLLWGEDDPVVPVGVAERLRDAIPTASLAVLPGCSHLLPEESPETVATLVAEWLRARYLGIGHDHAASDAPVLVSIGRRPPLEHEFLGESFDAEDEDDEEEEDEP
jgi:pimeloyl-ACP methyl ester carboxylesterase